MTPAEFNSLAHVKKDELVYQFGVFIANYDHENTMCDVYKLQDFFVMFCYDLSRNEKPEITGTIEPWSPEADLPKILRVGTEENF